MSNNGMSARRTIRRYAHELYPHPDEGVQPLREAVPCLYARAIGLDVWGTDWFDAEPRRLASERIYRLITARSAALHADALLQGLSGEEAWTWAEQRANDETGECVRVRAVHYGIPVDRIKPYPVLAEAPTHYHHDRTGNATGWGAATLVECPESECEACTEPIEAGDPQ